MPKEIPLMPVTIDRSDDKVIVRCPYNLLFVNEAAKLRGIFEKTTKSWSFDARDESRLREICLEYFGCDGISLDVVTLRILWRKRSFANEEPICVYGRPIAGARNATSGAKLSDGIVLLQGHFDSGYGSKNVEWTTTVSADTVVLVRDFPRTKARKLETEQPHESRHYSIEPEHPVIDRPALEAELLRIRERAAHIEELLNVSKPRGTDL